MGRHDQLENMDMTIDAEQSVEMEKNALHFTAVEVMQETVDQYEVKAGRRPAGGRCGRRTRQTHRGNADAHPECSLG